MTLLFLKRLNDTFEDPNVNLLKAPADIIDYAVLHELCHFKIKQHSHRFWNLMHKFMPRYQEKINWLKVNGNSLI
jgi:predicted metal-dependent hydrolase